MNDIVYLYKRGSDEILYSIRSVVKNFPYRKLVIVGEKPEGITPDLFIPDDQKGSTKWERSMHSMRVALEYADLTDDIWLFNDDFFIMNPVQPGNYFNGTLEHRINQLKPSGYRRELERLRYKLLGMKKDTLSFTLHVPMLINRAKAMKLFKEHLGLKMFRSMYGNVYEIPCSYMRDCKIYDLVTVPSVEQDYVSTSDEAWNDGLVGPYIRACFPEACKYESSPYREIYTEEGDLKYE